jgi:hypothetical protein
MSKLRKIMSTKLPPKAVQRKLPYKISKYQIKKMYKILNKELFNNRLPVPRLTIRESYKTALGHCEADVVIPVRSDRSSCEIVLTDRWYCKQWCLITLAHEMVHQYQWDILNREMSHGPSFYKFRKRFERKGIPLYKYLGISSWFRTQNFFKSCTK